MTPPSPEDRNPFEAPRAEIGARAFEMDPGDDAERVRRLHLRREASIRSVGLLCYLTAAVTGLFSGVSSLAGFGLLAAGQPADPTAARFQSALFLLLFLFYGAISAVSLALGFGLRRLQAWARWTTMLLAILALLYLGSAAFLLMIVVVPNPGATAGFLLLLAVILGYVLTLLATPRSGVVFSPGYREVIARTPHLRPGDVRPPLIAAGLLVGLLILVMLLAVASLPN